MKYYIYSHSRLDTGDIFYIGIGSTKNPKKFDRANDFRRNKRNFIWYNVYESCGFNIKVEILFVFDTQEEVFKKEVELIKQYGKLIDKKGGVLSNISPGGENGRTPKKVIQYNLNGKPLKIWNNVGAAAKKYNITEKGIYRAILSKYAAAGYCWRYLTEETKNLDYIAKHTSNKKEIYQFDLSGNYINKFESTKKASLSTGIDRGSINRCALGTRISCGGFKWSYNKHLKLNI